MKSIMRALVLSLFSFSFSLSVGAQGSASLVIIHTADLHSRLQGYAPESAYSPLSVNDDATEGGFARIAGLIKQERIVNPGSTLVFDAGDFTMGTLFPSLEEDTGFQLRMMKAMGYDAVALGNHEYDFGPAWIASVIKKSYTSGAIPALLATNARADASDPADDSFAQLFDEKIIVRELIIEKNGIKTGIFSLLGRDADNVAPKARPVHFEKQKKAAKTAVENLRRAGCDLVICLSHSGINGGPDAARSGEDIDLAKKVKGIDIILGGHSHSRTSEPYRVGKTLIVHAGEFGKTIGRLEIAVSDSGCELTGYKLIKIDDKIAGDEHIASLIDEQKKLVGKKILEPLRLDYDSPVAETAFELKGNDTGDFINSNLGPLAAEAVYSYVNRHNETGTDIAMVAAGLLFDNIQPGSQTAADLFRVLPMGKGNDSLPGYPLSRLWLKGRELRSVLEILLVAYRSSPANYCYYSGFKAEYDPSARLMKKIKSIEVYNSEKGNTKVDFSRKSTVLYSVTANSYMLEFIGIIKKMSFGLINVTPRDEKGNKITDMQSTVIDINTAEEGIQEGKEWLALIEFLKAAPDTDGDGIPEIPHRFKMPFWCFVPLSKR